MQTYNLELLKISQTVFYFGEAHYFYFMKYAVQKQFLTIWLNIHVLVFILVIPFLNLGCSGNKKADNNNGSAVIDTTRLVTQKYHIEGMTCPGCENTVNYIVGEIHGVTDVHSSYKEKYSVITYDSVLVDAGQIEKAITSKGYKFHGIYSDRSEDKKNEQNGTDNIQE